MPRTQGFWFVIQNGTQLQYDLDTSIGVQLSDETINSIAELIAAAPEVDVNPPTVPYVESILASDARSVTVTSAPEPE